MRLGYSPEPIRLFISSGMNTPEKMGMRRALEVLGKRLEFFRFDFIERDASPASVDDQMRMFVSRCDALVMILHNESPVPMREGVYKEYMLARTIKKPLFLFIEHGWDRNLDLAKLVNEIRADRKTTDCTFANDDHLIDDIERSIHNFLLDSCRGRLEYFGMNRAETEAEAFQSLPWHKINVNPIGLQ